MLILIAGITGFVGIPVARAALARGHKVRGLARNASKLPKDLRDQLEGFETLSSNTDSAAIDKAVAGVDAIVNTMTPLPELIIEFQILLLRAAERAGVKIFHSSSWNADWHKTLGQHEIYDLLAAFAHYADLTSTVNPIHMFTGAIAEWYFVKTPRAPDWDSETKTFSFYGPSTFCTRYTTADDIANYVLEAITAPDAADGGSIYVQSFEASPEEVVATYNKVREGQGGTKAKLNCLGTLEDAKRKLDDGRAQYGKKNWWRYAWYVYQYHIPSRSWDYEPVDVQRFSSVKQTSLEEFFRQHPEV